MRKALSYSQYEDLACGFRYKALHLDRQPVVRGEHLDFGGLAHEAIQAYVLYLVDTKQDAAPQAVEQVFEAWLRSRREQTPVPGEVLQLLRRFATGFRLDRERLWQPEADLAITWDGQPCDWYDPRVWLRGKLDLPYVSGALAEVLDWKTSWQPAATDEELKQDLQAKTYAMLLNRHNPRLVHVRVTLVYVRYQNVRRSASFMERDFQETFDFWRAVSEGLEKALSRLDDYRVWGPRPGPQCSGCPVALRCPISRKIDLAMLAPQTLDDARQLFERVVAMDAAAKAGKDMLRAFLDRQAAPLIHNGLRLGWTETDSWDYPVARTRKLAEEYFFDPDALCKIDHQEVKKLEAKNPALFEALRAIATSNGRTEFRYRRAKTELPPAVKGELP